MGNSRQEHKVRGELNELWKYSNTGPMWVRSRSRNGGGLSYAMAGADVSVGEEWLVVMMSGSDSRMVERGVVADGEGVEIGIGTRSQRVTSMSMSMGVALVDSRVVGRGTKELGLTGQVSNAVERDWGTPVDCPPEGSAMGKVGWEDGLDDAEWGQSMGAGVTVGSGCVVLVLSVPELVEKGAMTSGDEDEEEEEGIGRVGRCCWVASTGTSMSVALVDSREIGRGTKELGLTGQVSNAVEGDWGTSVDGADEESAMGEVGREGARGDVGKGVGGSVAWDGDEEEGGREWRRARGMAGLMTGLLEMEAKGLAVRGRREEDGDDGSDEGGWVTGRLHWRYLPALDLTLVNGTERAVGTGIDRSVWISVRTRIVRREAPDCADLIEGEVGKEGDDTDAREEERGRGAASDAEEGDGCGDITFVGGRVLVEVKGSMGDERRVEEGEGVIGRREG
jgi:hypothetical protein